MLKGACEANVRVAAALPLTCNGRSVGVLLVTHREVGSLNDQIVSLLESISVNISYALNSFDREQKRRNAEHALEQISRMFAALSATNEAIMRAKYRTQFFEQAIISMGEALGMTVVAESVENAEQKTFLLDHACNEMHCFLFSKPLPPSNWRICSSPAFARLRAPFSPFDMPAPENPGGVVQGSRKPRLSSFDDGMACCTRTIRHLKAGWPSGTICRIEQI